MISSEPGSRPRWWLHALGLTTYVVAGLGARELVLAPDSLALLWPAGGAAATWCFFARDRELPGVAGALLVATVAVNALTGAGVALSVVFAVTNLSQALVFVAVLRRVQPHLWGPRGGAGPVDRVGALGWVVAAAAVAVAVAVGLGVLGMAVVGTAPTPQVVTLWLGGNLAGLLAVFVIVHLLAHRSTRRVAGRVSSGDWAVMTAVTVAVFVPVFVQDAYPLAFLPALATLAVGLRSDTVVATAHALLGGGIAVALTILDRGPFHLVPDLAERSLVVQLFLVGTLVGAVFVSAARQELALALREVAGERQQVAAQAEVLASALDHVSDGVVVIAADGRILRANPGAETVMRSIPGSEGRLGVPGMTRPDGQPVPHGDSPSARALRGERVTAEDVVVVDREGLRHTYVVSATPLEQPGEARVVTSFRDVTEDRAQIDQLTAFASLVAHDITGPITTLRGWCEVASGATDDPPLLVTALGHVDNVAHRLDDMVHTLLLHVTSRERALERKVVDLAELAAAVVADQGVGEHVEVGSVPSVVGDAVMLRHLLENLVGNAVKYARDGVPAQVRVTGRRQGAWVVLSVADNGMGVPEEMRRAIFDRFLRVPGTGRRGTGLGLAICHTIAERHGGTIEVGDGPGGVGSTFSVRLPAA